MKTLTLVLLFIAAVTQAEIYKWRDASGVNHYSNSTDDIPLHYRTKAKTLNYGTEQKQDAVSGQPSLKIQSPPAVERGREDTALRNNKVSPARKRSERRDGTKSAVRAREDE
jgi:hypothetical protein